MEFRVLFIGDIVGRGGLDFFLNSLSDLRLHYPYDALIVNGENIVNGKGLTKKEADLLFSAGVHIITTGNHVWENWKARSLLTQENRILRPLNYPSKNPGRGYTIAETDKGEKFAVIQLQGRIFLSPINCPFQSIEAVLPRIQAQTKIIIVDFHAEATAEKWAMGWFLDGKISLLLGTHTHVQTNDARILPAGTGFISDVGMTGSFDSVIGLKKEIALKRFLLQTPFKYEVATGDYHISAVYATIDKVTGKTISLHPFIFPPLRKHAM